MKLSRLITVYTDNFNYPIVICTEYPFLIAYPMMFNAGEEHPEIRGAKVKNYNIIMTYGGSLVRPNEWMDIEGILEDAAEYYYDNVIIQQQKKFKESCEDRLAEHDRRIERKANNRAIEKERKFKAIERKLFKPRDGEE